MENKIIITEEIKDKAEGKLDHIEVGKELIYNTDCKDIIAPCAGNWVPVGGICICDTAP